MEHNGTEELDAAVSSFENRDEQQNWEAFARTFLNDEERPSLVPPPPSTRLEVFFTTVFDDPEYWRSLGLSFVMGTTARYRTKITDPHDGANQRERYQWPPSDPSVKTFVKDACSEMQKKLYELGRNLGQELFVHEDILSTAAGHVSPRLGKFNKELMKVMNVFGSLGDLVYSKVPRRQLLIRIAELTGEGLHAVTELVSVNTGIIGKVKEDVSGSVQKYLERYTSSIQCWMPAFLEQQMRTFIPPDWSK